MHTKRPDWSEYVFVNILSMFAIVLIFLSAQVRPPMCFTSMGAAPLTCDVQLVPDYIFDLEMSKMMCTSRHPECFGIVADGGVVCGSVSDATPSLDGTLRTAC